jgi:hypothetical protein
MRHVFCTAAIIGFFGLVAQAEQIDNPAYVAWAKQKVGTSVTFQSSTTMEMGAATHTSASTMTETLQSVDATAATLKTTHTMQGPAMHGPMGGGPTETTHAVPAKVDKEHQYSFPQQAGMKGTFTTSNETNGADTITVMGKSMATTTHEMDTSMTMDMHGTPMTVTGHIKLWSNADIPGGLVQTEMTQNPMGMKLTTKMTLTDVKPAS